MGSFTVVLGKSGCGKTTMLRLMAGLAPPSSGKIVMKGGRSVGVVFQEPRLMPWLSVRKNVELVLDKATENTGRIEEILRQVGLSYFENAMPSQLSGGMSQRVALARALAYEPEILLMDEPFGALDYFTRRKLQQDLSLLVEKRGLTVVLVTHDVEEAIFLASRIVVMGKGRILSVMEDVNSKSMNLQERETLKAGILASLDDDGGSSR
ncbi:ATP-binding cassette domain-containing protein [Dethiosulfovibrio acidaminovorans]|uniref:ATP-binding cassette domain-containing protein n=2 Tax=Dethiosulfovibrio TaxID=47054 RepID=A0ABS9EQ07_9BACT|nr:ATP-binding cassette domain-containing protein [Dethiosulfovibrio russensis]MCF4143272.1 ATP-binding cassette domain-containing protein [Dethiosulfovibrio marinus]MCF4145441.1 ATP-binding cassette domain-containing protein [Dethiosulfovibrio acidaminovorans]